MKILAIESTGNVSGVSIVTEDTVLGEISTNNKKTHAEMLMPMIENLVNFLELSISDMDYVACSQGPGSFTGLRIGAAAAKGIAQGIGKPIIPVPTLDALAYNIPDTRSDFLIAPIMDARRNQVYTAFYRREGSFLKTLTEPRGEDIDKILEELKNLNENVIFLGDGVKIHESKILNFSDKFVITSHNNNLQRASSVGLLAASRVSEASSYLDFVPFYLRLSQAERERLEKNND